MWPCWRRDSKWVQFFKGWQNVVKIIILDFFQQYDTDGDMIMSKDELERMRKSLEQLGDFQGSTSNLGQKGMWLYWFRFLYLSIDIMVIWFVILDQKILS